jgi:hypothetical protein
MDDNHKGKTVEPDDVAAGAVGAVTLGGAAAAVGGLGAAGLAIGGTAVAIPAIAVVGIPAIVGGACGVGIWKVAKALTKKKE